MNLSELDRMHRSPKNWRWYFLYYCPDDPRIIVPKRIRGTGWTINLARPAAAPFFLLLVAVVYGVKHLAAAWGAAGSLRMAIDVLLCVSIVAICHRLANPRQAGQHRHH